MRNGMTLKVCLAASVMSLYLAGCGDDVTYVQTGASVVSVLNPNDCNDKSEGSMAFVKSSATMYECADGEWIAINDEEAIKYRCGYKELDDKKQLAIICDGDTIGIIRNGKDGVGIQGVQERNGDVEMAGGNGGSGASGKDGVACTVEEDLDIDGYKVICGGEIVGRLKNGKDGKDGKDGTSCVVSPNKAINGYNVLCDNIKVGELTNGKNADMDAIIKSIDDKIGKATTDSKKEIDEALANLSSASAKNQKNVDDALKNLSSASAKNQKDVDDALKNLSSAMDKFGEDIDNKFNDVYSSWNAELENKSCAIVDMVRDNEKAIIIVTIRCGEAETKMEIPFTPVNENLAKVYKKHVVVRFPVKAEKTTNSKDIYEEIWKNLKGGNHTELTVVDLDEKLNATGKMFVTDLFADATKSGAFVTVEETNEKKVEYKVARLEGDVEVTNLSTPIAQLRIKMNLSSDGITTTNVIYSAITDLSDESDTVVIDFLTDYKVERVKKLVLKGGSAFADASAQANIELAKALSLVKEPFKLEAFEHYLPGSEGVGLNEYFNSVVWVMALIDQGSKVPDFNKIYNEYRKVFAENGDFNQAIETTYAGKKQSMFFVDYLALLINAHFFKWNCALDADGNVRPMMLYNGECETDDYRGHDEIYYKILQDGFVSAYKLDTTKAVEFDKDSKIQKSEVEGGHFRYFEYYRINRIWYPASNLDQIAFAETGKCDATAANAEIRAVFTVDNADYSMLCQCERGMCGFGMVDPCLGRDEGYEGFAYFGPNTDLSAYVCKKVCYDDDGHLTDGQSGTCNVVSYVPSSPSLEDVVPNGKTIDEILNPAEGEGPLGKCTAANKDVVKSFDEKDAERSTTTGYGDYICNGAKWVKASPVDLYCVGDNVKATEQKVADEDFAALGLKYDQKCEFEDVLYVRNSEEAGSEWTDATGYIRRAGRGFAPRAINGARIIDIPVGYETLVAKLGIRDSVYVFMNGYKENAIYKCIDGECSELSDDNAITSTINKFRDENGKNSFTSTDSLSIFCNKAEYKKAASGYVAGIAYEVELGNAASKTKYVASANRKDWHEVEPSDLYGECSESVMKNAEANWVTVGGQKYACDCDQDGDKLECDWRKGTATETAVDKPCTKNIADAETVTLFNGPNSKVYLCKYTPIPDNLGAHDLVEATVIDAFGECNDAKMKAQTKLSMFGKTAYKCDCEGERSRSTAIMYSGCAWIQATELEVTLDAAKNAPCTAKLVHEEDGWTFSKNNLYYCGQKGIENTNDHEHNWLKMTSDLWCSVKSKPLADHENCTGGNEACSICNDIPEGVKESGMTFIYRANSGATETVTAETYFGVDCSQEPKFIGNLESYEKGEYNFSENKYKYTVDNSLVHDFICKNGHVAEAADANEACNATFEKTEICTYMNEQYEHNGSGWVKMNCSTLHDENGRETKGRLCTMADGSEHYREWDYEDSYQVGIGSSTSTMYYNDKWYDVSDYCATKGDHCYKEGQEPQGESSSFICEFVRRHMEKEVFYCDQTDGVWKKDLATSADDYCNRKLKMEYGIVSCSSDNVEAFCQGKPGDSGPCSNGWFTFSCIPPSDLTPMEGCSAEMQYQCSGEVGSTEFHLNCL